MVNTSPATLSEARKAVDKTQAELAAAIGVNPSTVGHWETGLHQPTGPARRQLAQALDAPLDVVDSWFPASTQTEPALAAAEG